MKFCSECGTTTVAVGGTDPKGAPSSPKGLSAGGIACHDAQGGSDFSAVRSFKQHEAAGLKPPELRTHKVPRMDTPKKI